MDGDVSPAGVEHERADNDVWELAGGEAISRAEYGSRGRSVSMRRRPCSGVYCSRDGMARSAGTGLSGAFGSSPWLGHFQMLSVRYKGASGHGWLG